MFDTCRACRRRLARRAEGTLPRNQWARLEAHLFRCATCRRVDEADRALHMALSTSYLHYSACNRTTPDAFDDRVLNLVLNHPIPFWRVLLDSVFDKLAFFRNSVMNSVVSQMASGAIVAASITASCLMYTLHPTNTYKTPSHSVSRHQSLAVRWLSGPPVPIEALLDTPHPSEALLWTRPATDAKDVGTMQANANLPSPKKSPSD